MPQVDLSGEEITCAKPFLKWAGGKSKLFKHFENMIPEKYNSYFEPFVGGGAVFFKLNPKTAIINDLNSELMNVYSIIKTNSKGLMKELDKLKNKVNNKDFYYDFRGERPETDLKKAARTIFLNKTGFNGMYRVNSKGEFNIPFGDMKNAKLYDKDNLLACSKTLDNTLIKNGDYRDLLDLIKDGDFVYLDPPYVPLSKTASFTSYTKESFGEKEQLELVKFCKEIDSKGARFLLNNSDTEITREIYSGFNIEIIKAPRSIAASGKSRKSVNELVVTN